jgi:hypothetical protein
MNYFNRKNGNQMKILLITAAAGLFDIVFYHMYFRQENWRKTTNDSFEVIQVSI